MSNFDQTTDRPGSEYRRRRMSRYDGAEPVRPEAADETPERPAVPAGETTRAARGRPGRKKSVFFSHTSAVPRAHQAALPLEAPPGVVSPACAAPQQSCGAAGQKPERSRCRVPVSFCVFLHCLYALGCASSAQPDQRRANDQQQEEAACIDQPRTRPAGCGKLNG